MQITRTSKLALTGFALMAGIASAPVQAAAISGLFNTGTDALNVALGGDGLVDTHYTILSSTSPGFAGLPAITYTNGAYAANDADSRWISLSGTGNPGSNTTVYRTTFDLTGLDPLTAQLTGRFGADNQANILLNGAYTGDFTGNFSFLTAFTIGSGFIAGLNTFDIEVRDFGPPAAFRIDDFAGTASTISAVPEPETYAMMLAGLGLLGFAARRKKLAQAQASQDAAVQG